MLGRALAGQMVFVLGSGPSLTREIADKLRQRKVLAVNSSIRLAPWADFLFFHDLKWWRDHRPLVETFPGVVITASERAERRSSGRRLILVRPPLIQSRPLSSGHHAVDIALHLGAAVVVLLGMDCKVDDDGRTHFDGCDHKHNPAIYARFIEAWADYPARAARHGARIINCTEGSAIVCFPLSTLDNLLNRVHSDNSSAEAI